MKKKSSKIKTSWVFFRLYFSQQWLWTASPRPLSSFWLMPSSNHCDSAPAVFSPLFRRLGWKYEKMKNQPLSLWNTQAFCGDFCYYDMLQFYVGLFSTSQYLSYTAAKSMSSSSWQHLTSRSLKCLYCNIFFASLQTCTSIEFELQIYVQIYNMLVSQIAKCS